MKHLCVGVRLKLSYAVTFVWLVCWKLLSHLAAGLYGVCWSSAELARLSYVVIRVAYVLEATVTFGGWIISITMEFRLVSKTPLRCRLAFWEQLSHLAAGLYGS